VASSCDYGNEASVFIKGEAFLNFLSDCRLLKTTLLYGVICVICRKTLRPSRRTFDPVETVVMCVRPQDLRSFPRALTCILKENLHFSFLINHASLTF